MMRHSFPWANDANVSNAQLTSAPLGVTQYVSAFIRQGSCRWTRHRFIGFKDGAHFDSLTLGLWAGWFNESHRSSTDVLETRRESPPFFLFILHSDIYLKLNIFSMKMYSIFEKEQRWEHDRNSASRGDG